jgi:hypothetical protein
MLPPQTWTCVAQEWLALPPARAWVLWRAVLRAQGSPSVQWRAAFLELARTEAVLTATQVPAFLGELITLPTLIALVEALMAEKVLLRHDGRAIEEHLFRQADAAGQWTRERRR